jgi:hypothetical protein
MTPAIWKPEINRAEERLYVLTGVPQSFSNAAVNSKRALTSPAQASPETDVLICNMLASIIQSAMS